MTALPIGWVDAPLGDLVVNRDRERVPVNAKERSAREGSVPYYGATGQVGWIDKPLFDETLLLLGEDGVQFLDADKPKAYMISGPSWVNNHAHVLSERLGAELRYLMHYLNQFDYQGFAGGTTRLKLTRSAMDEIPVRLAPSPEQQRIVKAIEEAVSKLEAGEAGLRTVRQLIKRMREAVLGAAVTGRLAPQDPTDPPAAKLLADLGVDPIEPEDVPGLPPGWAWVSLGAVADVVGGVTKDSKRANDPDFVERPYLRVANVQRGYLDLDEVTTIRVARHKAAELELRPGDVLFNEGGDRDKLGRGWIWEGQVPGCIHQNHVFRARLGSGVEPRMVSIWGNTFGRQWFEAHGRQTTNLASINVRALKSFPIPVASAEEQVRILAEVERQQSVLDACEAVVDAGLVRSAALRRSVLKSAFEGKLAPQDPTDDPASALLERIKASRPATKPGRRARVTA